MSKASDKKNAYCKACNCVIQPRHASLMQHRNTKKHIDAVKGFSGTRSIQRFLKTPVEEETKKAELRFCAALVEHNVPFKFMDHLSDIISTSFPDSAIAHNFSCKRTKAAALTYNVLSTTLKEKMLKDLHGSAPISQAKFSLIIDESTDISVNNNMAIVCKYYSAESGCIKSKLLNLKEVTDKTAKGLFKALTEEVTSHGLDMKNIIGFAADTTNVIFGEHNSIVQRLKDISPDCVIVKCVCHSTALAVSKACQTMPRTIEDLVRETFSYFAYSSKRKIEFKSFQEFADTPDHRLLKLYDIRWLSLFGCIERILEQWSALEMYFNDQHLHQRVLAAERLYNMFNNPYNKLYLLFLSHVMSITTKFNMMFQAQYANVMNVYSTMSEAYKSLASLFLKMSYVRSTDAKDINLDSSVNFVELHELYLGVKAATYLTENETLKNDKLKLMEFFTVCQSFLISLCKQIRARLPFESDLLPMLSFIDPATALGGRISSLLPILMKFPHHFIADSKELIDSEWRVLPLCTQAADLLQENPTATAEEFWFKVSLLRDIRDPSKYLFRRICHFVFMLMSLPVSNADCERIFSQVTMIKTKYRNRLTTKNTANIIIAKQGLDGNCAKFTPDKEMLLKFNSEIYK